MHTTPTDKRLIFYVFVFFLIVNFLTTGAHTDMWDGMVTFMVAESMAIRHSAQLHPDIPTVTKSHTLDWVRTMISHEIGNYMAVIGSYPEWLGQGKPLEPVYSSRNLLLPAIAVPFHLLATALSLSPLLVVSFFSNSLLIALASTVLFCFSLELYNSRKIAFVLGLIFCVCSFFLPYNSTFFPQPLQTLLIFASLFLIYKCLHLHPSFICYYSKLASSNCDGIKTNKMTTIVLATMAGVFLGMAVFAHPSSVIVIPGFVLYVVLSSKNRNNQVLTCFLVSLVLLLLLVAIVNHIRFGSFTEFGYGRYYGTLLYHQSWTGLVGLLASPGKGLIFYFPPVIMLPFALRYLLKQDRILSLLLVYVVLVNWIYFGTIDDSQSRNWSGAVAWGPRYLVPVLPFITLALGALLSRFSQIKASLKALFVGLCIGGFIINLPGTLVWSEYGTIYGWDREKLSKLPAFEMMAWNPQYSHIVLHFKALADDYVSTIPVEQYRYSAWHYTTYALAPCSYDLYIFCTFGIIPMLVLSVITIVLAIKVMEFNISGRNRALRFK